MIEEQAGIFGCYVERTSGSSDHHHIQWICMGRTPGSLRIRPKDTAAAKEQLLGPRKAKFSVPFRGQKICRDATMSMLSIVGFRTAKSAINLEHSRTKIISTELGCSSLCGAEIIFVGDVGL